MDSESGLGRFTISRFVEFYRLLSVGDLLTIVIGVDFGGLKAQR